MNAAVNNAIDFYANSLGVTKQEAINLYKKSESTRECIALLVLAQADPAKLKAMVSILP